MFIKVCVPNAWYRIPDQRAFRKTYPFAPPTTVYGFLLSYIGETDVKRYLPCKIGIAFTHSYKSTILRTQHKYKDNSPMGTGKNRRPMLQELLGRQHIYIYLEDETALAKAVAEAYAVPKERFGVLSMGESFNMVDSVDIVSEIDEDCKVIISDLHGEYIVGLSADADRATGYGNGMCVTTAIWEKGNDPLPVMEVS